MRDLNLRHARPLLEEDVESLRLRRQWAILDPHDPRPSGWIKKPLCHDLTLVHHPELQITGHTSPDRGLLVLGCALQPSGAGHHLEPLLQQEQLVDHDARVKLLESLGGIYVLLHHDPAGVRLYTDPAGMMPVYYSDGRAASTPTLLPELRRDAEIDRQYPMGGPDDWYPGGLSPFVGVRALIANHALDVKSGASERFWPVAPFAAVSKDEGIDRVCTVLREMVRGYVSQGPCLFSLTGGKDTRVNLAAARPFAGELEFFTVRGPETKPCDIEYSGELARRFGLNHRYVENEAPPDWLSQLFGEMAGGMEPRGARSVIGAARYLASSEYTHVSGALGAIAKSIFWPSRRPTEVKVRALAVEFLNKAPCVMRGLEEWYGTLSRDLPATTIYNLMYLEQRGGRWQSIAESASNLFYRPATPFCSREVFEAVCSIPVEYQYGGDLLFDFAHRMWPELREVPYCPVTTNYGTYFPKFLRVWVKRMLGRPV